MWCPVTNLDPETLRFALALTRELALPGSVVLEAMLRACDRGRAFAGPVVPSAEERERSEAWRKTAEKFVASYAPPKPAEDPASRKIREDCERIRRDREAFDVLRGQPAEAEPTEAEPDRVVRVGDRWRRFSRPEQRIEQIAFGWARNERDGAILPVGDDGTPIESGWIKC